MLGLLFGIAVFLRAPLPRGATPRTSPGGCDRRRLVAQLRLGVPMGLSPAADLLGFAIFQMMQTRLGTAGGAATQMVVILTSLAYMPGFGIASAGTTLVGQSIGAGARDWALRVGDRTILLAALYMGGIGVVIALGGPWVLPFFTGAHDAESVAAVALGVQLLWLAAGYQFFDGLNLGSSMCLRGAGDVRVPAALVLPVSLLLFVPLAHALTFAPGQGWVHFLPQFGYGASAAGWPCSCTSWCSAARCSCAGARAPGSASTCEGGGMFVTLKMMLRTLILPPTGPLHRRARGALAASRARRRARAPHRRGAASRSGSARCGCSRPRVIADRIEHRRAARATAGPPPPRSTPRRS